MLEVVCHRNMDGTVIELIPGKIYSYGDCEFRYGKKNRDGRYEILFCTSCDCGTTYKLHLFNVVHATASQERKLRTREDIKGMSYMGPGVPLTNKSIDAHEIF
jgi:hypothetical protein